MRRDDVGSTRLQADQHRPGTQYGASRPGTQYGPIRPRGRLRTWLWRGVLVVAAVVVVSLGLAAPASAHVIVTPSTTAAGANALLEFSIGHGCGDSPTTRITIQMPQEITSVTPTRSALWTIEKKLEKLDPPRVDAHGNKIVERVAAVTFSTRTPLPDGQRDVLELAVQLPNTEGATLVFPTIQTCVKGESAWIEVPQNGQDIKHLDLPAPGFVISAADGDNHHGATSTTTAAAKSHTTEAPAAPGTSNTAQALALAALATAVLATLLAGTALLHQRRQP